MGYSIEVNLKDTDTIKKNNFHFVLRIKIFKEINVMIT